MRDGNYLRVRGEYPEIKVSIARKMELPPRARRIRIRQNIFEFTIGTTSACAENTEFKQTTPPPRWNYLRVRGEYLMGDVITSFLMELPPRARRILSTATTTNRGFGTTSACAENTLNELGLL